MAWRLPRFSWVHALRDAGADAISSEHAFHADYPKTRLIDERKSINCKFDESTSGHTIVVNRGSGPDAISRLFIPSGHNFTATTDLRLEADSTSGFTSVTTLIDDTVAYGTSGGGMNVGTGDIVIDFTANSEQWVRLSWPSQTGQWELPELILTHMVATTAGPQAGWTDQKVHNAIVLPKASGERPVLETGPEQREFEFTYLYCETADIIILESFIENVGLAKLFLFDPPHDDEDPLLVRLSAATRVNWAHPIPASGVKAKKFVIRMLESID